MARTKDPPAGPNAPQQVPRQGRSRKPRASGSVLRRTLDRGVLMLDRDGQVTSWNEDAEGVLGARPGGLRGRSWHSLLAETQPDNERWTRALATAMSRGVYEAHGWRWRMDGSRFWASISIRPARHKKNDGSGFVAVVRDLTREKRHADELRGALEISRAILAGQAADAVFQLVADRARVLVDGDCALVRTPDAGGDVLVLRAVAWRDLSDALLVAPAPELVRRGSTTGQVFDTGQPRLVPGRQRPVRTQATSETLRPLWPGVSPALHVPLNTEDLSLGTIVVLNWKTQRPFSQQDLDVLQLLGREAALAIHHARINREQEQLAVAQERERLGRELHDGAIQSLYAVTIDLAGTVARTADHRVSEQLAGVARRIDTVIDSLRAHIQQLRSDLNPIPQD